MTILVEGHDEFEDRSVERRFLSLPSADKAVLKMTRGDQARDVVLTPVAPTIAPLYKVQPDGDHQFSYTVPYSLSGNPCVVVRAGTSSEGMPIGVQVVAGNFRDATALRAARAIERALGGWRPASVIG